MLEPTFFNSTEDTCSRKREFLVVCHLTSSVICSNNCCTRHNLHFMIACPGAHHVHCLLLSYPLPLLLPKVIVQTKEQAPCLDGCYEFMQESFMNFSKCMHRCKHSGCRPHLTNAEHAQILRALRGCSVSLDIPDAARRSASRLPRFWP